jgi:predicted TIM-barrel fold metal-dependent hydrolase
MQTSFGDLAVVDAHAHFFSYRFFAALAASLPEAASPSSEDALFDKLAEHLPFEFPPKDPEELAKRWVEELDHHGVARCVLIASVPGDEESVAVAARAHPERFIPYFMLNPRAADALERTKRGFRELGMKGLCLFPAMHHFHMWEKEIRPILEEVAAARGVVFVHCGVLKVGVRDKLGLPSPFDSRFANPIDLSGVAKDFDTMPFIVPHFGSGFFRELLLVTDECANIYTDTSSSNAWASRLPTPLSLTEVFERSLHVLGAERMLYGSDSSFFPRGWQKDQFQTQVGVLEALGVTKDQAAAILGGNLARLVS